MCEENGVVEIGDRCKIYLVYLDVIIEEQKDIYYIFTTPFPMYCMTAYPLVPQIKAINLFGRKMLPYNTTQWKHPPTPTLSAETYNQQIEWNLLAYNPGSRI